jgi:hypothetical protein
MSRVVPHLRVAPWIERAPIAIVDSTAPCILVTEFMLPARSSSSCQPLLKPFLLSAPSIVKASTYERRRWLDGCGMGEHLGLSFSLIGVFIPYGLGPTRLAIWLPAH